MEGIFADPRFGVFGYLPLVRQYSLLVRTRRRDLPCNRLDLRDFSRVQQDIRSTTERSPDIQSNDELSRKAGIRGAGYIHNGSRGKVTSVKYFPVTRHTFPYITETKSRRREHPHNTLRLIPSTGKVHFIPHIFLPHNLHQPSPRSGFPAEELANVLDETELFPPARQSPEPVRDMAFE